jgi:hypothetical protein
VENLRRTEPQLGVHPTAWPEVSRTRRWYEPDELESARRAWTDAEDARASLP